MLFLYLISVLSFVVQGVFLTLSLAAGLFYLAELVEEYTVMAKYVISWIVIVTSGIYIGLILFEDMPLYLNLIGLFQQILYGFILKKFPIVRLYSFTFILALVTLVAHHYFSFTYFGSIYYTFSEMLGYYTVCLWLVPFALFVSLTANEYVLPTTEERQHLLDDDNVVTDYLSRKANRYNLLSFFSIAKESILPQRIKKF